MKELETAFDSYARHRAQIATLRGWSLTVFLAYVGFLIALKSDNFLVVLPYGAFLLLFVRQEAKEQLAGRFDSAEVQKVEEIFTETNPDKFTELIRQYEFRETRLHKLRPRNVYSRTDLFKYMISRPVVAWYGLQFMLVLAAYLAVTLRLI